MAAMELDRLDRIAAEAFDGYIVRKDLVRTFARHYPVPTYVCEFLLGRYCASINEDEIAEGLAIVERQLRERAVRSGEEELFKLCAREKGVVEHAIEKGAAVVLISVSARKQLFELSDDMAAKVNVLFHTDARMRSSRPSPIDEEGILHATLLDSLHERRQL